MAIYLGRYSTAARGKLGGIVLHGDAAVNIMRSRAIPVSNPTIGQLRQIAQVAQGPKSWLDQYSQYTFGWEADVSWITYGSGPDFGNPVNPNNMFNSAQSNAALLGTVAYPSADGFPSANPPVTALTLTGVSSGAALITPYNGADVYGDPVLIYLTGVYVQPTAAPPTTGGTFIGGSLTGGAIAVQESMLEYLGQQPSPGQLFTMLAVTTYETNLITSVSSPFLITTGA